MEMQPISQCPGCSAVIIFTSSHTQFKVCSTCGATILKRIDGTLVREVGALLEQKNSIIQPGTTGIWKGKAFTIVGRFLAWFDHTVFNYWTIHYSDQQYGLLAEGYGLYMVLEETDNHDLPAFRMNDCDIGDKLVHKEITYLLEKKDAILKYEIEGELWLRYSDRLITVYDFASTTGKMLTIFSFGENRYRAFTVMSSEFDELQLKNLRTHPQTGTSFNCLSCSLIIELKAFPYTQSCACASCFTFHSYSIAKGWQKETLPGAQEDPLIPIGSTGNINAVAYEVIGYVEKMELNEYNSKWREYALFNSSEGFAFLFEYDGHWMLVKETVASPIIATETDHLLYNDVLFQLYNAYTYKVISARGEFSGNVFNFEGTNCREYINPPEMWISERSNTEGRTWFLAKHITPAEVGKAFNIKSMPYRNGMGAVQPFGLAPGMLLKGTLYGIILLLVVHLLTTFNNAEQELYTNTINFPESVTNVSVVTPLLDLDKTRSNLKIGIIADVDNSWLELSATLVNVSTGTEYSVEQGVEYYHGYSGGESWAEGSRREEVYFTGIPRGKYKLQLQGTKEYYNTSLTRFEVSATYDVTSNRNLWWSLGLFLIYPVALFLLNSYNERARWSNSPYSKYEED